MNISGYFLIALNILIYIAIGYIFVEFIKLVYKEMYPKFMKGRLTLGEIVGFVVGFVMLLAILWFGPGLVATSIQNGWNSYKTVMFTIADEIVNDAESIMTGGRATTFTTGDTKVENVGGLPVVLPGNINPITNEPYSGSNTINPVTGQEYSDPNAGGGIGVQPTPIMPEMRQPTPQPTPTLMPTPTPFDVNTWTPGQPVPTPEN